MQSFPKFVNTIDQLNEKIGKWFGWVSTILVAVVCYDVFTRYLLRESSVAVQELEWHLFAVMFLIAAAYTLKHDRHVRVDVFYSRFSPRLKAWINLFGSIVFLIPFCLITVWASWNFVLNSFRIGETSPDPGGLPARYVLKAVIPLSFILILLQGISLISQSLRQIRNEQAESEEND